MPMHAYTRVRDGLPMPGLVVVHQDESFSRVIDDIVLLAEYSLQDEWEGLVLYIPL